MKARDTWVSKLSTTAPAYSIGSHRLDASPTICFYRVNLSIDLKSMIKCVAVTADPIALGNSQARLHQRHRPQDCFRLRLWRRWEAHPDLASRHPVFSTLKWALHNGVALTLEELPARHIASYSQPRYASYALEWISMSMLSTFSTNRSSIAI